MAVWQIQAQQFVSSQKYNWSKKLHLFNKNVTEAAVLKKKYFTDGAYTTLAHCLKITQNVAFEFLNFDIFHQIDRSSKTNF